MKLNVKIYEDKDFMEKTKQLVLNRINEVIKSRIDFKKLITEIVDKYIQRNVVQEIVEKHVDTTLETLRIEKERGFYNKETYSFSEYIRKKIDDFTKEKVNELFVDYQIDIFKKTKKKVE